MNVAIVGGGAAGFFAAIWVKENNPEACVTIFERGSRVLAKVRISGGGRCNFTNSGEHLKNFTKAYPRGANFLKKAFHQFSNHDAMRWFEENGVPYVIQSDGCIFPESQRSQSVIEALSGTARKLGVKVVTSLGVNNIIQNDDGRFTLILGEGMRDTFDKVIVTTGGTPSPEWLAIFERLGHKIVPPIPSLFTFEIDDEELHELTGLVVEQAIVSIVGTKIREEGALLITHWGVSGPAVLKASAYGARILNEASYRCDISVNWAGVVNYSLVVEELNRVVAEHGAKQISNFAPYGLQNRLWRYLIAKSGISSERRWSELGSKGINRLAERLTNDIYHVTDKGAFKDEFVTCGGISLECVDANTMQSKVCSGLYFAGEILDIDGITGGFNFQAAWTTGFIAGKLK
ncbi:MAG: NAD(P)/FAD-dependent oxidoreductase [Marinifilaceae bacterium]|nr:NAD(P)/FAD-dependent oxidoreductase [Marinifilaceae bacterium]